MVNVGKMSKANLAQLSAQRATDEYNIVETRSQLLNYKLQLKQLLEITDETEFDVAIPEITDTMVLKEVPTLQGVYEQALLMRWQVFRLVYPSMMADLPRHRLTRLRYSSCRHSSTC